MTEGDAGRIEIGGVLVSAAVMDLIAGRIEEPLEELGPLKLRNMSRAPKVVAGHAYAVGPGRVSTAATAPRSVPAPIVDSFQRRRPAIAQPLLMHATTAWIARRPSGVLTRRPVRPGSRTP